MLYCNKAVSMSVLLWLSWWLYHYHIFLLTIHLPVMTQFTEKKLSCIHYYHSVSVGSCSMPEMIILRSKLTY